MPHPDLARLERMDRESWLHPFTRITEHRDHGATLIVEGDGVRVRDARGRDYLDAMAGLWCVNAGYGRGEIVEAIAEQARRLPFYHAFAGMGNEPSARLAARLLALAPVPMSRVFFGVSGSDANETQIKLVWRYNNLRGRPRKKKIVSRRGGYHGVSLGAASLTGLAPVHTAFDLPLPGFLHVSTPHHTRFGDGLSEARFARRLAEELDETIRREGADTVAAFIAEPVMGAGGVIVPPETYFAEIQPVLDAHDVLFIADEVICGFGRLGRWFGTQRFDLKPDLITLAKGLTSGYVPMSACLISERVYSVLEEKSDEQGPFTHGFTYSGHPVSAAAALANLDLFERDGLVENAEKVGAELQSRLRDAFGSHPKVAEVRGVGMIAALEIEPGERAPELFQELMREGLLTRVVGGNAIALSPPLILESTHVDEIVEKLERGLSRI